MSQARALKLTLLVVTYTASGVYLQDFTNPQLNGIEVFRDPNYPVIIQSDAMCFRVPVRENRVDIRSKKKPPMDIALDNIGGDTGDILIECFQLLRRRINTLSAADICKRSRYSRICNQRLCRLLYHLLQTLAHRMDPRSFNVALEILEVDARTQCPEKWMTVSDLMHGVGNHSSIWILDDEQKLKQIQSGDSKQLTKDILHEMSTDEVLEKESFVIAMGTAVYESGGGGERGNSYLMEIVEEISKSDGKNVIVKSLFEEVNGFPQSPSSRNIPSRSCVEMDCVVM